MEAIKDEDLISSNHASSATSSTPSKGSRSKSEDGVASNSLSFPAPYSDPIPHLAPLRDNHSAYSAVSRSCLHLNQYAGYGSSSTLEESHSVASSALFHDANFAKTMSSGFASLIECIQSHDDRRSRIISCKTLALVARSTYARIRHSPHLFALRDSTSNRLEDEVGTEVPMALCTAALDDPDDGVSASALQSLGIMALSSSERPGTLVEDELMREILAISQGKPAPYTSAMLDLLQDQDPIIPQMELQARIYENIMSPRLLQLVCRVTAFDSVQHIRMILPFLTASLVHIAKTTPPIVYSMDRATYAKRWAELDFVSLVNDVVEVLLLPAMQSSLDGHLSHAAALSAIRLAHACPQAHWVLEACQWAVLVLKEECTAVDGLEARLTALASLVICTRTVPLPERSDDLTFIFRRAIDLPSATIAPLGIYSSGLLLESRGVMHYRRPTRAAFLAEIALSFFMDGPVACNEPTTRSDALNQFLRSPLVASTMKEPQKNKVTQVREELVTAFCMVAAEAGRRQRITPDSDKSSQLVINSQEDFEEWLRMSLAVLTNFTSCIGWGSAPAYMEEELSLLVAAQASYVRLVQEVLHAAGLLNPMSVSLRMAPTASPPNMLWDQIGESASFLGKFDAVNSIEAIVGRISGLLDEFVKKELKGQGIVSHHMRLFLLSLAADQWVQERYLLAKKEFESNSSSKGSPPRFNMNSARDLLVALSPRRVFSKVVECHKSQIEQYGKKKKELYKKYAQDTVTVCVACIENIASTACDWQKRFGATNETKHVLTLSIASLQGKNPSENDADAQAPVLPVCQGAIERIKAAFESNEPRSFETLNLSPLLAGAGDLKRRPVVTAARSQQGRDLYNEGYLMQLSRQIVGARIDQCLLSVPTVPSLCASARKQNWLRLAVPPLPAARNPQRSLSGIPRYAWGSNVSSMVGGSDAAALTMAYSLRRNLRYDGEEEFRLMVVMRVHNTTAVEITEGLRLELGIVQQNAATSVDEEDPTSMDVLKSLGGAEEFLADACLSSAITVYRHELKRGEHITWEIMLDTMPTRGPMSLHPSIVYRAIEIEPANANWVGGDKETQGDTSVMSSVPQLASHSGKNEEGGSKGEEEKDNVLIPGEPLHLSPLVGLQPCPLVFFRDGCGDIDTFRFLWSRQSSQIPPLRVAPLKGFDVMPPSHDSVRLAAISTLRFPGEPIPGGFITTLWAFMSLQGKRVLCVMAESEETGNNGSNDKTIHIRGDDKDLLWCLAGTAKARAALVSALAPGLCPL